MVFLPAASSFTFFVELPNTTLLSFKLLGPPLNLFLPPVGSERGSYFSSRPRYCLLVRSPLDQSPVNYLPSLTVFTWQIDCLHTKPNLCAESFYKYWVLPVAVLHSSNFTNEWSLYQKVLF